MTGSGCGSPCGACKFLRRKCVKGCVFAPYFCHEQGASNFAAIHKVFGASNVSKLLAHLPVSDRCGAAITISYEAQARLKDPIYGCVSHIFALQQQVISLQAQLASIKEQSANNGSFINGPDNANWNQKFNGRLSHQEHAQNWFQQENSNLVPQFSPNLTNVASMMPYLESNKLMDPHNLVGSCESSVVPDENVSYGRFDEASDHFWSSLDAQTINRQWGGFHDSNDLHSGPFNYTQQYS
ncbi:LOB domain-containing protein 29-like [Ziziphus jujuba]|uniref:LOB domain-containing protein 29 n=1 Tax=Ziziphus jujuba TaxID=326968 RepID=A0A6P4A9N0_ZIZJJ|nr:LOB domain-containing protein 29 [Ziziphus jujuba]XP_060667626.1 LOB domain-containing protein 29-like [Ziziphus jujuba]